MGLRRSLVVTLVGVVSVGISLLLVRYRKDLRAARRRLAQVDRRIIQTDWGEVEYAEQGVGEPVLVLHSIFHGCDGGPSSGRDLGLDHRSIAPSRFGYLGSDVPEGATPADQADALAALLDALGISDIDVIGISAGATSALQFALRHPDRVKHLAVLVGNLPGNPMATVQPSWARLVDRQLPIWAIKTYFPAAMARMAGVPRSFPMNDDEARFVREFIESMFPITPRLRGVFFDVFVSNAAVNDCNLEAIRVPTLIVHTKDDPLASHDASERAAERIPGARFVSLETGGHLMLGQAKLVHDELMDFFAGPLIETGLTSGVPDTLEDPAART